MYLKTLSFQDIEKCSIEWSSYRVPVNYKTALIKVNPPLSEEEFEKELNSPYKVKKYHYNFRQDDELTEENLRKTFINLCTSAFFHNKEKTIREEHLNFDSMNSKEKEDVIFRMKTQLESLSDMPLHNESFFSSIHKANPLQAQFNIWKKNLYVPLHDQLEEKAKRKIQEIEEQQRLEREKESIFFEGKRDLYDPDKETQRMERHQAILKQHLADERKKQGVPDDPMKDSVDSLPVKRKQKWRIW